MLQWPRLLLFRMVAVKKTVIIISRSDKVKNVRMGSSISSEKSSFSEEMEAAWQKIETFFITKHFKS